MNSNIFLPVNRSSINTTGIAITERLVNACRERNRKIAEDEQFTEIDSC